MKRSNDKIKKEEIRKYRRLKRKAKRLKRRRALFRFILNKVIPFTLFRFFLKNISSLLLD